MKTNDMRSLFFAISGPVFFLLATAAFGQGPDTTAKRGIFDLLTREQVMDITITTDVTEIMTNKRRQEYLDATFSFEPTKDVEMSLPVRLRLRGRYRRMKCDFPPLKLKFRKDDLAAHDLNEFNELKLVTHCMDGEGSRELICREYLAYRLFNILCHHSFRAQLVKVTYKNIQKTPKNVKGWGIIIEDADEQASRMGGIASDTLALPDSCFNAQQENLTALFQFMVGNTDWDCRMARNVALVKISDSDFRPIPYDFDFSGLVNAPYARYRSEIGQDSLRHRVFLGKATSVEELRPSMQLFLTKKEALLQEVNSFDLLTKPDRKDMADFLEIFFQLLENEELARAALFPPPQAKVELKE